MFVNDQAPVPRDPAAPARLAYILYLAGILAGITLLIGLVIAYANRDSAPAWLQTHYRFQIRTFWIGLIFLPLVGLCAVFFFFLFLSFVPFLLLYLWLLVRAAKGLGYLSRGEAHPRPASWGFG